MANSKFYCPHCNTALRIDVDLINVREDEELVADSWQRTLTPEQIGFVEQAKTTGLYDAFLSVIPAMRGSPPKWPERFFVGFFRLAKQKRIPSFALDFFVQKFGGQITFFSAQGIGLVVSDGHPVHFVPIHLVGGESVKSLVGHNRKHLTAELQPLAEWVRTHMGYCPPKSLLLDELRRKSIGEFARPAL